MIVRFTLGGRRQFLAAVRYIVEQNPPAAMELTSLALAPRDLLVAS